MKELHPRRAEILKLLARWMVERGAGKFPSEPPSVAEIAGGVGLRSTQTAHHHLGKLEEEGYIERGSAPSYKRRPMKLTEKGWQKVGEMPLMGRIAAGRGLEAIAEEEAYSLAGELLLSRAGKRRYLLRVVGDSMIGAHIADGDLIVVEEDEDPPEGAVVVALIGGGEEVTVKRLYRERGGEEDLIRLRPQNGDHEDILLPASEVTIQGRVVQVIHPPRK